MNCDDRCRDDVGEKTSSLVGCHDSVEAGRPVIRGGRDIIIIEG